MKKYFKKVVVLFFAVMLFLPFIVKADETYTVQFDTQGGTEIPSQVIESGGVVVKPEDPTNGNLEFVKWVTESIQTYDFTTPVTSDMTLKAFWRVRVNAYTYPEKAGKIYTGNNPDLAVEGHKEGVWTTADLNNNGGFNQMENPGYVFKEWRIGSKDGEVVGTDSTVFPYSHNGDITFKLNDNYVFYAIYERTEVDTPVVSISANNNKLTLSWEEQPVSEKAAVYRSLDNKKWEKLDTITTNTYTDKSLTYGKTYYYKVKVYGKGQWSSYSAVVSKKVVPNKVKNLKIKSANTNTIKLEWDKVSVSGYVVYRSTDNKTWSKVKTITKNTAVYYDDVKLKANKRYYYKVRAYKTVSGKKVYGKYSDVVTTKTAPKKPIFKIELKNNKIIYSYSEVFKGTTRIETRMYLKSSPDNPVEVFPNELIFKIGKTENNYEIVDVSHLESAFEEYNEVFVKYKACNSENRCSGWTTLSIEPKLQKPTITIEKEKKDLLITTKGIKNTRGYVIYRSTDGKNFKKIADVSDKEYKDTDVKKNKKYYYKVKSYIFKYGTEKRIYSSYSKVVSKVYY